MGKVYLVGMGPGDPAHMTPAAEAAIRRSEVLCGYTVYLRLLGDRFPDRETYTTPMGRELERCRWAVDRAAEGRTVAMLCSGDAGVYGMAGPVLEMARGRDVDIEVVPGITAAISGQDHSLSGLHYKNFVYQLISSNLQFSLHCHSPFLTGRPTVS